jgi:hypothetical protein
MSLAVRVYPEPLRSVSAATITAAGGGYVGIGTALINDSRTVKFYNGTDVDILFSWDGVTPHEILPSGGFFLFDICSNRMAPGDQFSAAAGTRFYCSGAPTVGNVYLSTYYGATFL